jgi:8-oxo-dGTP diphosphatase
MNHYVLGFAFDHSERQVLLINKERPDWQKGRVNGVGGKIEIHETALEAMTREFQEEAGLFTSQATWRLFCKLTGGDYTVYCYGACLRFLVTRITDEWPEWFEYDNLPRNIIPNLTWLVPMAMAAVPVYAKVDEGDHNACR